MKPPSFSRLVSVGFALIAPFVLAACGDDQPGGTDGQKQEPAQAGYVSGVATDQRGNPLAGAQIHIYGSTIAGASARFETATDAAGRYKQRVPDGIYGVRAEYSKADANGATFVYTLHPEDGVTGPRHDAAEGVLKNFVWRISGLKPGQAAGAEGAHDEHSKYYGGALQVTFDEAGGALPDGAELTLTLEPERALLDGSEGETLAFSRVFDRAQGAYPSGYWYPADIPLGFYKLSATLTPPGGAAAPAGIKKSLEFSADYASSVSVAIIPDKYGSVLPIQITVRAR